MRTLRLTILAALMIGTLQAQVLWDKARYGMSEAGLKAVYGPALAIDHSPNPTYFRAYLLHRQACGVDLQVGFIFEHNATHLDSVSVLTGGNEDQDRSACLEDSLTAKYGRPTRAAAHGIAIPRQETVWIRNGVRITAIKMHGMIVHIRYERTDSGQL